jgi:hypothetical protein
MTMKWMLEASKGANTHALSRFARRRHTKGDWDEKFDDLAFTDLAEFARQLKFVWPSNEQGVVLAQNDNYVQNVVERPQDGFKAILDCVLNDIVMVAKHEHIGLPNGVGPRPNNSGVLDPYGQLRVRFLNPGTKSRRYRRVEVRLFKGVNSRQQAAAHFYQWAMEFTAPVIHFVWIGKPDQDGKSIKTPLAVANECPLNQVWLWVLEANAREFDAATRGGTVKIMKLDVNAGWLSAGEDKEAFRVINTLIHYQAWAAAKDLAALLIMSKYGGLFLDCTTMLATADECATNTKGLGGVKAQTLGEAVEALGKGGPKMPVVAKENTVIDYQNGAYTIKSITSGCDEKCSKEFPIVQLPQVDVWSYFSLPGHAIFSRAVRSYIRRAKVLGLDKTVDLISNVGKKMLEMTDDNMTVYRKEHILAKGTTDDKVRELMIAIRTDVIGKLISHSIYDGLVEFLGRDLSETRLSEKIKAMCWRTARFTNTKKPANLPWKVVGEFNADIVPELGIIKQYAGSWQGKAIPKK